MSVRSTAIRIGIAAAGGALTILATTGGALAANNDDNPDQGWGTSQGQGWDRSQGQGWDRSQGQGWDRGRDGRGDWGHHETFKGRVIARSGLLLRDAPTRSADVVRSEPFNAIVHIFCKTTGDNVDGNNRWYLLTDGTWAWGSARYIENIGEAPRWC